MNKTELTKLINNLPETIEEVNSVLDEQDIIMIDFMDGEQVLHIEHVDGKYQLFGIDGGLIRTVDLHQITKNSLKD